MFKAVITKDELPYPPTGLTTARWIEKVPVTTVRIRDLIATQDGVYFNWINDLDNPYRKDKFIHVVKFNTLLYLEDGHHRAMYQLLRRKAYMSARVLDLDKQV